MQKNLLRKIAIASAMLFFVCSARAQDAAPIDIQAQLQQIMNILQEQQKQIKALQETVTQQQTIIDTQQQRMQEQDAQLAEQKRVIEEQPSINDITQAWVHFKTGAELQHKARFDVRRRDAKDYYLKAIEEYMEVVEKHPNTPQASECLYRIGQINHRYLKDYEKAREFYSLFLERYPNDEQAADVRQGLSDLRGR